MVQIITTHITYAQLNKAAADLPVPSALESLARGFLQPRLPQHQLVCLGQSLQVSQAKYPLPVIQTRDSFSLCQHQSHPKFILVILSELVCNQFMWEPTSALQASPAFPASLLGIIAALSIYSSSKPAAKLFLKFAGYFLPKE